MMTTATSFAHADARESVLDYAVFLLHVHDGPPGEGVFSYMGLPCLPDPAALFVGTRCPPCPVAGILSRDWARAARAHGRSWRGRGYTARSEDYEEPRGPHSAARFVALRLFGWAQSKRMWTLHPKGARHPVLQRRGSSDLDVFGQIFSGDEYAAVSDLEGVRFVIDGGGNVGYSAAYFLSCYPAVTVASIEPDCWKAALLRRNLAPYGERSVVIEGALWSTAQELPARNWLSGRPPLEPAGRTT